MWKPCTLCNTMQERNKELKLKMDLAKIDVVVAMILSIMNMITS